MPPHSKSDMGCDQSQKCDQEILEISDKLQKIDIQTPKTEDEQCTYNIEAEGDDDDEVEDDNDDDDRDDSSASNTTDLHSCAKIKEKGPIRNHNNNRLNPLLRNPTSGGHLIHNENVSNTFASIFEGTFEVPEYTNPTFDGNNISFNDLQQVDLQQIFLETENNLAYNENFAYFGETNDANNALNNNDYSVLHQPLIFNENSSSNELQLLTNHQNIPVVIEQSNFPQTSTNRAEQALSNDIDQNKKLKQIIWIKVNTQVEKDLIATLREKITCARFTKTDLNFIYAIIIRLMKNDCDVDGKRLLVEYFQSDVDVLFKIAIKGNVLLMDFILEVIQNLGMNPNQFNVLHQIVGFSGVDLSEILDGLLNKTFDNKPSLNMFDVNCVDSAGQTILMVVVRNISLDRGLFDVNMKYLDLILRRMPDVTYVTLDGRNVFQDMINCARHDDVVQKFLNYYDPPFIQGQIYYNGWGRFPQ